MFVVGIGIFIFLLCNIDLYQLSIDFVNFNWGWFSVVVLCICFYLGLEGVVIKFFMVDCYLDFSWKNIMWVLLVE